MRGKKSFQKNDFGTVFERGAQLPKIYNIYCCSAHFGTYFAKKLHGECSPEKFLQKIMKIFESVLRIEIFCIFVSLNN